MPGQEIADQEKRTLEAMARFRAEAVAYRKLTGRAATFLHDGEAAPLRPDALARAQLYPDRFAMMQALVAGGTGAEVGVQFGEFSRFLLDRIRPEKLFLYDLAAGAIRKDVLDDPRVTLLVGDSSTRLGEAPDQSFDWIYIDGDHRREGVRKDTEAARRKIKPGGWLIFNDYTRWSPVEVMPYGVVPVVNALVNEGYPVGALAIPPHGYHDIAIRYLPLPA